MPTSIQLVRIGRTKNKKLCRTPDLRSCPQKKGRCVKVYIIPPKKPHSGKRKVTRVWFRSINKEVIVYIPGIGHSLKEFGVILVRGGRTRDLPGLKYKAIRSDTSDLRPVYSMQKSRSKYGKKKINRS